MVALRQRLTQRVFGGTNMHFGQGRGSSTAFVLPNRTMHYTPVDMYDLAVGFTDLATTTTGEVFGARATVTTTAAAGTNTVQIGSLVNSFANGYGVVTGSGYQNIIPPKTTYTISGTTLTLSKNLLQPLPAGTTLWSTGTQWIDVMATLEIPVVGGPSVLIPFTFSGYPSITPGATSRHGQMVPNIGCIMSDQLSNVRVPAGMYAIHVTRIASDLGAAGNYAWLYSHGASGAHAEGGRNYAPSGVTSLAQIPEYVTGSGIGLFAQVGFTLGSGGQLNSQTLLYGGNKQYTAGANLTGNDRAGQGYGLGGYSINGADGNQDSFYNNTAGQNYSANSVIGVAAASGGGYGAYGGQQGYGPCLITGSPAQPIASVLCLGDSLQSEFGAVTGSNGDDQRRWGPYERSFTMSGQLVTSCNYSQPGLTAYALAYNMGIGSGFIAQNVIPTATLVNAGTNDFLGNGSTYTTTSVETTLRAVNTYWRNLGVKQCLNATIPTRVQSIVYPATVASAVASGSSVISYASVTGITGTTNTASGTQTATGTIAGLVGGMTGSGTGLGSSPTRITNISGNNVTIAGTVSTSVAAGVVHTWSDNYTSRQNQVEIQAPGLGYSPQGQYSSGGYVDLLNTDIRNGSPSNTSSGMNNDGMVDIRAATQDPVNHVLTRSDVTFPQNYVGVNGGAAGAQIGLQQDGCHFGTAGGIMFAAQALVPYLPTFVLSQ